MLNRKNTDTDIIVIGGGPSGSIAAALLAQDGYEVVLLDKCKHPRPSVGESLIPYFWQFCDKAGATQAVERAGFVKKAGGIVAWGDTVHKISLADFGFQKPALHVERDLFDKILLDNAGDRGVDIRELCHVTNVELNDTGISNVSYINTVSNETVELTGRYIIDASGQSSVVANQYGFREFDEGFRFSAIWGYYRDGQYLSSAGNACRLNQVYDIPPATFVESTEGWGWTWHIALRDSISVGIIIPIERFAALKKAGESREAIFKRLVSQGPRLSQLVKYNDFIEGSASFLRDYAYKPKKLFLKNCLLIGDAAAFVDPVNSAGVTFGMYAACLAATVIDNSLKQPRKQGYYQSVFESMYRSRLDLFRLIAYPDHKRDESMFEGSSNIINMHSKRDLQLVLTQAVVVNRYQGLFERVRKAGMDPEALIGSLNGNFELNFNIA